MDVILTDWLGDAVQPLCAGDNFGGVPVRLVQAQHVLCVD
jgi:hypothetical protein